MPRFKYFLVLMKPMHRKKPPEWPWWRAPFRYLLRVRLRRRHVHGTFLHRMFGERALEPALWIPSRDAVARGLAFGTFTGLLPLPGLQIFLAALVCYFLRANVAVAALATLVSNPFTALPLLAAQYQFGGWLMSFLRWTDPVAYERAGWHVLTYGKPLLVGSLLSAVAAGLIAYPLAHGLWAAGERLVMRRREARVRALRRNGHRPDPTTRPPG